MPAGSLWGVTPRQSIEAEVARRGRDAVVTGCIALVRGEDVDLGLLLALGGPAARKFLDLGPHADAYWLRVWGARGLPWCWDDAALGAVVHALGDESWRVREMALRVVARHRLGDALPAVDMVRDDEVQRVRTAASRAMAVLTRSSA